MTQAETVGRIEFEERAPDFLFGGRPVFRCRVCGDRFERIEGLDAVIEHERKAHAIEPPLVVVRESPILQPDGKPFRVAEEVAVTVEE